MGKLVDFSKSSRFREISRNIMRLEKEIADKQAELHLATTQMSHLVVELLNAERLA